MIEDRIAHDARASRLARSRERIAEAVEEELERLRELRPHLESRIDRAAGLLVLQLASPPHQRPIKVRTRGEDARFLVASSSSENGAVYSIDVKTWACSCPDHHRRNAACKHALAAYVLKRAARRPRRGCMSCSDGWVYLGEDLIDSESGEVTTVHNPVPCRRCQPTQAPYLSDDELREWMESVPWRYAKTMPKHPHEYTLRHKQDGERFRRVVQTIWALGWDRRYLGRIWRSLDLDDFFLWVYTDPRAVEEAPVEETVVINRAERRQQRLV